MFFRATTEEQKTIPSADHWNNIQKRVDQFNAIEMKASDAEDETCYQQLNAAIATGIKCGQASENQHIWTKKSLSSEASAASKKVFAAYGNEEIPTPVGAKSLAFIQAIYLPYYLESQHIKITALWGEQTLLDIFTSGKKAEYAKKATALTEVLENFNKLFPEQAQQAAAAVSKVMPAIDLSKPAEPAAAAAARA